MPARPVPSRHPPARGEVWIGDLDPTRGREQAGTRPVLVVSMDAFNSGPAGLAVVIPLTTTPRGVPLHVPIASPEGGLKRRSFVKCEDVRSVARERLSKRLGTVSAATLAAVEDRLRILLDL